MKTKRINTPLAINIFWHNASEEMHQLADVCYDFFLRNVDNPIDRYLGIPVYFYPYVPEDISELHLETMEYSANIFLVDDHMNLLDSWEKFADKLVQKIETLGNSNHRIFPVAINKSVLNFTEKIQKLNFIKLYEVEEERTVPYFLISLAHEISRLLFKQKESFKKVRKSEPPIRLFISHAKKDGEQIALNFRKHIHEFTNLDSFFDAYDVANGFRFPEELEAHIEQSVLVIIHTDEYSSREWCRREVLLAKKYNCPVIVVNQFDKGELRSFPYIGNVPHINYAGKLSEREEDIFYDHVVLASLRETLKAKYNDLKISSLKNALNKKVDTILSYPPELVTLVHLKDKRNDVILYPDPPLGTEEIELLKNLRSDLTFITSTLLPLLSNNQGEVKNLSNQKIAISLSETNYGETTWIQNRGIQDLMVEITRYLLVSEAQLIYSGKIDYDNQNGFNFSLLLLELVENYRSFYNQTKNKIKAIRNYSTYPFFPLLTTKQKSNLKKLVDFIEVKPPDFLKIDSKNVDLAKSISAFDSFDKKYAWAKSLTEMRNQMLKNATTLIVLGGKWIGFKGSMSGILEETLIALKAKKPIFLIGGFGGVAKGIIDALNGKKVEQLQLSFYETYDSNYVHFLKKYNEYESENHKEYVDYKEIVLFLNSKGNSEKSFGLNNGLSKKENQRLFESRNEIEILSLILNGIKNINS